MSNREFSNWFSWISLFLSILFCLIIIIFIVVQIKKDNSAKYYNNGVHESKMNLQKNGGDSSKINLPYKKGGLLK